MMPAEQNFSFLDVYFEKASLLPAIVQEESTGEVLMLAYMNRESFQKTLETGYTWFWSRSRQELWNKGATSMKITMKSRLKDSSTMLISPLESISETEFT